MKRRERAFWVCETNHFLFVWGYFKRRNREMGRWCVLGLVKMKYIKGVLFTNMPLYGGVLCIFKIKFVVDYFYA